MLLYPIGTTDSCRFASEILSRQQVPITDHPSPEVTHLLLDIPSFQEGNICRSGESVEPILSMLPENIRIIGGNLNAPAIAHYRSWDLLKDPFYLAHNAAITADCALRIAGQHIRKAFSDCRCLLIGSGRIARMIAGILQQYGCDVSVAARNLHDRAMIEAQGFSSHSLDDIPVILPGLDLVINTVPAPVLTEPVPEGCTAIDLASRQGITDCHCILARGLPGKMAPESSGALIAKTVLKYMKEELL